jgi:hypothetical protein
VERVVFVVGRRGVGVVGVVGPAGLLRRGGVLGALPLAPLELRIWEGIRVLGREGVAA